MKQRLHSLSTRWGYDGLPPLLLRYILLVSVLGPLVAVVVTLTGYDTLTNRELLWMAILLPLTATSERFPLHLTHKTSINVTSAAVIVMYLLLPSWLPGLLAFTAAVVAHRLRDAEMMEAAFNAGQTALYATAGALTYHALYHLHVGPHIQGFGALGAIAAAAVVMHLVNTMLVALAGAFQLALNPLRVWATTIALDWMPHVTLCALGTIAAVLARDQPLVLPFLALPAVLVHQSVRQTVQLRVDTHEALASLVEVIELRDPYTAGHSRRVAALARIIAGELGLTPEEADLIEQAGRVHDIGKAALDSAILSKPGTLSDEEWVQMKLHPVTGANVVARFAAYRHGALLVRHHHESWDGSGYPDGVSGDAIPLGARIIAVADTFDALTTSRPYRGALPVERAIAILEEGAGRQWDARVVAAACAWLRELDGELPTFHAAIPRGLEAAVANAYGDTLPGDLQPVAVPAAAGSAAGVVRYE